MSKYDKKRKKNINEDVFDNPFDRIFADYDERQRIKTEAALKEANINPALIDAERYMPQNVEPPRTTIAQKTVQKKAVVKPKPAAPAASAGIPSVTIGSATIIGKREYQQDALASSAIPERDKYIAVLCDGMGGMNGGERASALCIEKMIEAFHTEEQEIPIFFQDNIVDIDIAVASICDEYGDPIGAGSTLVSVIIDRGDLYWASVGDSHIYVIRGDEMLRVNTEHNYMLELQRAVQRGEITQEQADADPKKEALISYMGMGCVSLMDINQKPLKLYENDIVLLCSDGLYRTISDNEILQTVKQYSNNPQLAADVLIDSVIARDKPHQDNTSVILVRYK
ncbi:MAG: protein phosphatase 2C domain-containing protein [Ruminococcus sp.]|nr:protein phosphatase 2C domain-containing protein [Ruminococcus sp.]